MNNCRHECGHEKRAQGTFVHKIHFDIIFSYVSMLCVRAHVGYSE